MATFRGLLRNAPQWGVSIAFHVVLFLILAAFSMDAQSRPRIAKVISELEELVEPEEFQEDIEEDKELELDTPVALTTTTTSGGIAPATDALSNPIEAAAQLANAQQAIGNRNLIRPLTAAVGGLHLDANIHGLKGIAEITGGGDAGNIMRITREIMRQLTKNKVIVAWILDSSASLDERRAEIAKNLDRVYHELEELGVNDAEGVLTSVVSAGQDTRFLIREPTADRKAISKAIRSILDDKTGTENVFTAIREAALALRRYQVGGRRTLMIVLVTDEIGDDLPVADDTVELLKRNGVPLYAMGPMASFARPIIHDVWQDPKSRFRVWQPIKRGPFTRSEEVLHVPFQYTSYMAGFGPFHMTRISRETGGIFFIYDDKRVRVQTKYDMEILRRYQANYESTESYQAEINANPLRRGLMEIVREGNNEEVFRQFNNHFYHWVHAKELGAELDERQKVVARWLNFANKAIGKLDSLREQHYASETSLRWQANYDLNYARLLLAKVRCDEYNWSCADFRLNPRTLKDPIKNNGWRLQFVGDIRAGTKPGEERKTKPESKAPAKEKGKTKAKTVAKADATAPTNIKKSDPKETELAKATIAKSIAYYDKVISDHSGTPWAEAAVREKTKSAGVDWIEAYDRDYAFTADEREALRSARERAPKK